jgi:hypothetical protein
MYKDHTMKVYEDEGVKCHTFWDLVEVSGQLHVLKHAPLNNNIMNRNFELY